MAEIDANGWNDDMTQAPKDGTRILAYVPPYGATTAHCEMFGPDAGKRWNCHSVLNKSAEPTHWMPLPAPPSHPTRTIGGWNG